MTIGEEVRRIRHERGLSQTKVAAAAGTGVSAISMIENGSRNPSAAMLMKLAGAMDVEVTDFFPKDLSHSSSGLEREKATR